MMFLVTLINPDNGKLVRQVFQYLHSAEEYCDYSAACGWKVDRLEKVEIVEW